MILSQPGGPVAAAGLSVNCGKLSLACFGAPARGLQQRHLQKVFMTSAAVVDRLLWRLFSREAGHTEQIPDTRYKIQDTRRQTTNGIRGWGLLCVQLQIVNTVVGIAGGRFVVPATPTHVAGLQGPPSFLSPLRHLAA